MQMHIHAHQQIKTPLFGLFISETLILKYQSVLLDNNLNKPDRLYRQMKKVRRYKYLGKNVILKMYKNRITVECIKLFRKKF